jgi:hypothetical protein
VTIQLKKKHLPYRRNYTLPDESLHMGSEALLSATSSGEAPNPRRSRLFSTELRRSNELDGRANPARNDRSAVMQAEREQHTCALVERPRMNQVSLTKKIIQSYPV